MTDHQNRTNESDLATIFISGGHYTDMVIGDPMNYVNRDYATYQYKPIHQMDMDVEQPREISSALQELAAFQSSLPHARYILVGISWGGFLAMQYASLYPHYIAGLLLLDTVGPGYNGWIEELTNITEPFMDPERRQRMRTYQSHLESSADEDRWYYHSLMVGAAMGIYTSLRMNYYCLRQQTLMFDWETGFLKDYHSGVFMNAMIDTNIAVYAIQGNRLCLPVPHVDELRQVAPHAVIECLDGKDICDNDRVNQSSDFAFSGAQSSVFRDRVSQWLRRIETA